MDNSPVALETDPWPMSPSLEDPWSGEPVVNLASPPRKVDPPPAPESRTGSSSPASAPRDALPQLEYEQRVLDVARMPASKLRFFPKSSGKLAVQALRGISCPRREHPWTRIPCSQHRHHAGSHWQINLPLRLRLGAFPPPDRRLIFRRHPRSVTGQIQVWRRQHGEDSSTDTRPQSCDLEREIHAHWAAVAIIRRSTTAYAGTDALGRPLRSRTNGRPTPRMSLDSAKIRHVRSIQLSALSGMSTLSNSGDSPRRAGSTNLPGEELEMDVQTPMADSHQYSSPLSRSGSQRDLLDDPFAGFGYSRLAGAKKKMVQGMVNGDVLGRNADGGHRRTSSDTVREAQQRRGSKKLD